MASSSKKDKATHLVEPHGGALTNLMAEPERAKELQAESRNWLSWDLTPRQLCDVELLLNGGFSPLTGFMGRADYESVCSSSSMRLGSGVLWPIPITLDVTDTVAKKLKPGTSLALRDPEGVMTAVFEVEDVWQPDRQAEAEAVFGSANREHPGVAYLVNQSNPWYVGGKLEGVEAPAHYDFHSLRLSPAEVRKEFSRLGWRKVVAFQTATPCTGRT